MVAHTDFVRLQLPDPTANSLIATVRAWSHAGYRIHRCYEEGHEDAQGQKKGKNPIGKWAGMWSWPQTDQAIDAMFEPGSFYDRSQMIALITPHGMVIFDIDEDEKKGFVADETLQVFCNHFDLETDENGFPSCPIVKTPSGGYHLYFTLPVGMIAKNWTAVSGKFVLPGIDLRTSGGGIALIPPSVRANGTRYVWAKWMRDIPPCKEKMVEACTPVEYEVTVGERRAYVPNAEGKHPYVQAAFDGALADLDATGKGGRNHALFICARKIGQWVAGGEIGEAEAKAAIQSSGVYNELKREDGEDAVKATVNSGLSTGGKEPKNAPPPKPGHERYNTPEIDIAMREMMDDLNSSEMILELEKRQAALRAEHAPEGEEDDDEPGYPEWVVNWQEGKPISGRAKLLLGAMVDREHSDKNFRQYDWKDEDGKHSGTVLMCAYRDPLRSAIIGIEEVWLPASGDLGATHTMGRPFNGICTFRTGADVIVLASDLPILIEVVKAYRSLNMGSEVGVGLIQDPSSMLSINFGMLPNNIVVALVDNDENRALAGQIETANRSKGKDIQIAWVAEAE